MLCNTKLTIMGITMIISASTAEFLRKPRTVASNRALRELPPYPFDRYKPWDTLEAAAQTQVGDVLGYTAESWNVPARNEIELLSFYTINATSHGLVVEGVEVQKTVVGPDTQIDVLTGTLDITEDAEWDCWVNHYKDFLWDELTTDGLISYVEALGWTEVLWEASDDTNPASEDADWFTLTQAEKDAAEALCYFPELWSGDVPISEWLYQPPGAPATTTQVTTTNNDVTVTFNRPTISAWDMPNIRFRLWTDLSLVEQGHATALGFNETTWNSPGTAVYERLPKNYADLNTTELAAATGLEINEFFWDCLIQHYNNFAWTQLDSIGAKDFWATLGWNYSSWYGHTAPPTSDASTYAALTKDEKVAADQLCYLPETFEKGSHLSKINLLVITAPPA